MDLKISYLEPLFKILERQSIRAVLKNQEVFLKAGKKNFSFRIATEPNTEARNAAVPILPLDQIVRQAEKVAALIQSKVGLNRRVFARNCEVNKIPKSQAEQFLNSYHLLNSTQSAWNYGLFFKEELLAVASFSKGRKMRRLPENLRSYELIRYCSKPGITVTGGLSKVLKTFIRERKAGDLMTYVDAQWSDGSTFVKAGFKIQEQQNPREFLVNRKNFERRLRKQEEPIPDSHYLSRDSGNIKLIYQVNDKS